MLPRMLFYLYRLRQNLRLKPSELQSLQWKQFRVMMRHAYEVVPFYHRKFKAAGINPEDIKGFHDLRKIPLTTRFEVQSCDFKDLISSNVDVGSLIKRTTSGSTGIPLTVFVDGRVKDFYSAVWNRAMYEVGFRTRDRMAVIADPRDFPKKKTVFQRLGITNWKYISIFDSAEEQLAQLKMFEPDAVKGYASSLFILANEFGNSLSEIGTRIVFSGAELLDEASRKIINSAFGGELFDFYACSELGLIAWECKKHNGRHLNVDSILVEFLDENGEAVAPNESGRIVCTSLINHVMPLIRYELADVAVPADYECTCGVRLPLIKFINGRADDFLMATDGKLISPTVFFPYPFESIDWIKQFRVIQETKEKLIIQVAAKIQPQNQRQIIENAERKIHELFGEDMNVEFQFLEKIPKDPSGKLRKVITCINGKN